MNEIINNCTNFDFLIEANKTYQLKDFSNEILKIYSIDNLKIKQLTDLLSITDGTIVKNRHGKTFLKYRKTI
jgi:hypothetical protein